MFEWILDPYSLPFWILIMSLIAGAAAIMSRPFLTYMKFVYPTAKFEAIGNPFIREKELNGIMENKNLASFIESLNTLKDYNVTGENISSIQKSLDTHLLQTIEMMQNDSSKKLKLFYETYLEKLDASLVKNELKKILLNISKGTESDRALLPKTKKLLDKLQNITKETLPTLLRSYEYDNEFIDAVQTNTASLLFIDTAVDKQIIKKLTQVKVPYKCERAKQSFIQHLLDIRNTKHLLRAKHLGYDTSACSKLFLGSGTEIAPWRFQQMTEAEHVPQVVSALEGTSYYPLMNKALEQYQKEKSVHVFENSLDSYLLKVIKDISLQNYSTIGPTLRFLVSKEFEIQNLKVITKAIGEQLSSEVIRRFLVTEVAV